MRSLFRLVPVALLLAACQPNQELPPGAKVRCASNLDCPADYECVAQRCKSTRSNDPPQISVGEISRAQGALSVPVVVRDAEGDAAEVVLEYRVGSSAGFAKATVTGGAALAATPEGLAATLVWAGAQSDLAGAGHAGYVEDLVLRLTPSDAYGPGPAVETAPLSYGNDAPRVVALTLDEAVVRGKAVLRFQLADSAADRVDVAAIELSASGDFSDAVALDLSEGAGKTFPGGSLKSLATSKEGAWHNVTWDSALSFPGNAPTAALRLEVVDALGAASPAVASQPFRIHNANTAPGLSLTPLTDLSATVKGKVQLSFVIEDADGDPCTVFGSYSLDGATWTQALTADPLVGLEPGVTHPFTWNTAQLEPGLYPKVWLRLQAQDVEAVAEAQVGPFAVDARGAVDRTPPDYIAPVGDFVGNSVSLQWTPRLGAVQYTVEIASEPSFASPTVLTTEQTSLLHELSDDLTYFWRVRADVTEPGQYSSLAGAPASFHFVDRSVYVHCPEADAACSSTGAYGTRNRPLRQLPLALARATALGADTVKVAARGGTASYSGVLVLPEGLSLLGGYSADFASRDVAGNRTRLSSVSSGVYGGAVVVDARATPGEISGFSLAVTPGPDAAGLLLGGCASGFAVRDFDVSPASALTSGTRLTGVRVLGGAPLLERVRVHGSGGTLRGLEVSGGATLVADDFAFDGTSLSSLDARALAAQDSDVTLRRPALSFGGAAALFESHVAVSLERTKATIEQGALKVQSPALYVTGLSLRSSQVQVTKTTVDVDAAGAPGTLVGVQCDWARVDSLLLKNSRVRVGAGSEVVALDVLNKVQQAGGDVTIEDSELSAGDAATTTAARLHRASVAVRRSRLRSGAAAALLPGTTKATRALSVSAMVSATVEDSVLAAGGGDDDSSSAGIATGVSDDVGGPLTLLRSIVHGGTGPAPAAVRLKNSLMVKLEDNLLVTPAAATCLKEEMALISGISSMARDAFAGCQTLYAAGATTYSAICGGNLGNAGCTATLAPPATGCSAGTAATLFQAGFDPADFATWGRATGVVAGVDVTQTGVK